MQKETSQYDWLRDYNWPDSVNDKIIKYLEAENAAVDEFITPLSLLKEEIFQEMKGRIAEDDSTVPTRIGEYMYHSEIRAGNNYWAHYRTTLDGNQKMLILDGNLEARGKELFRLGEVKVSPSANLMAYSVDFIGAERYSIIIKDLQSGIIIDDSVVDAFGSIVWNADSRGFFYLPAGEYWRSDRVMYHKIGTPISDDKLVYQEMDNTFSIVIGSSSSERYLMVSIGSADANEVRCMDLSDDSHTLNLIAPRQPNILYDVTHHGDAWYILSNDKGRNFRLVKLVVGRAWEAAQELLEHKSEDYLTSIVAYRNHLVLEYKRQGLVGIKVLSFTGEVISEVTFDHATYAASHIFTDFEYDTIRYYYSSLATPPSVYEYDGVSTKLLKAQVIPSGFNGAEYEVKREWIRSEDGALVPVSLLWKKSLFKADGSNPLYLYGYGAYGIAIPSSFRGSVFSLVDRGFVYAISHIRGGDDLGYEWYESAKFLTKKRTFQDFIAVSKGLIEKKYTSLNNIVISGGSAGGMLVGYVVNAAPELFKAAVMHVPFVDVLSTMLDETLPLTPGEFKEWGNPKDPVYYEYIKSYSPFDNISAQAYPHLFVTAGLYDPRVTYWESAKFVSKLRDWRTNSNLLLFKTNMSAGHLGRSGRYEAIKEMAEEFTFILRVFENK